MCVVYVVVCLCPESSDNSSIDWSEIESNNRDLLIINSLSRLCLVIQYPCHP